MFLLANWALSWGSNSSERCSWMRCGWDVLCTSQTEQMNQIYFWNQHLQVAPVTPDNARQQSHDASAQQRRRVDHSFKRCFETWAVKVYNLIASKADCLLTLGLSIM